VSPPGVARAVEEAAMATARIMKVVPFLLVFPLSAGSQPAAPAQPKPATAATKAANAAVLKSLPFETDKKDFEEAQRGLLRKPETLTIKNDKGEVVWDLESYKQYIGLDKPAPDTVNPSLWRNAQLCLQYGLFEVIDGIYQVRGYDLSNVTFVRGNTGWIVFDPLISAETAKAAHDLVTEQFGARPIVAIVYSHSHVDHYGGVRGIVSDADVAARKVRIVAPEHFLEHAISENVIAGNAMGRRAIFMFGALLPRNAQGGVNGGLGMTSSAGTITLIEPTDTITRTGQELAIDGVRMVFQMTPGTEAPAEMNTWFPERKALWLAENATNTFHNILTLRGAQVRDALNWAKYLNEAIELYGAGAEVKFQSHHWPKWGNAEIVDYLKKQRDLYKYIHDQSVRLMNQGYTGTEIADTIQLPSELGQEFYNRDYYGTVRHNSRAVYQRYMGWYDANPTTLNQLPPEPAAKKYVEYMGGENAILKRAKADFDEGEYRWVAEALKHVVFANPENRAAKDLLADTYEQMGYQAESGPWRSIYLQGAHELRNGVPSAGAILPASPDTIRAMPPEMLFDYLGVRLNGPRAASRRIAINVDFTDLGRTYALVVENGVLNHSTRPAADPDATLALTKASLDRTQLGEATMDELIASGDVKFTGNRQAWSDFMGLLDTFPFWFPIVTP
jgi:alkyl sulfatase BDS1-like metallo-beta-lactamase superfamily hydrolase